jgi:hypothetical protein
MAVGKLEKQGEIVRAKLVTLLLMLGIGGLIFASVPSQKPVPPPSAEPRQPIYYDRQGIEALLDSILAAKGFAAKSASVRPFWQDEGNFDWSGVDEPLIDKVEALMLDENAWVRSAVADMAVAIGEPARRTLPTLLKSLAMRDSGDVPPGAGPHPLVGSPLFTSVKSAIGYLANGESLGREQRVRLCAKLEQILDFGGGVSNCNRWEELRLALPKGTTADRASLTLVLDRISQSKNPNIKHVEAIDLQRIAEQITWTDADRPLIDRIETLMLDDVAGVRVRSALIAKTIGAPARHTTATLRRALDLGARGEVRFGIPRGPLGSMTRSMIVAAIWSLEGSDALSGEEKAARCAEFPTEIQPLVCSTALAGVLP